MRILNWQDYEKDGPLKFLTVENCPSLSRRVVPHTHNFAEITWIQKADCYHQVNGKRQTLEKNSMVFIRPEDSHCFRHKLKKRFLLCNIAFPMDIYHFLCSHYRETLSRFFPNASLPVKVKLDRNLKNFLNKSFETLKATEQSRLAIESFLVELFLRLEEYKKDGDLANVPDWLTQALKDIKKKNNFSQGTTQFYQLCSRCPEHISRQVKKHTGKTVTSIINEARLEWIANQLITTSREISEIVYDSGFESLSYFYKLFRTRYKTTPAKYRKQLQLL